jgi:hypothetical protein
MNTQEEEDEKKLAKKETIIHPAKNKALLIRSWWLFSYLI